MYRNLATIDIYFVEKVVNNIIQQRANGTIVCYCTLIIIDNGTVEVFT
jgi:hypothetical protein